MTTSDLIHWIALGVLVALLVAGTVYIAFHPIDYNKEKP